ncbi:SET domain-containing protein [Jiulongibacter sediminis]|uniref:SET domain protein n=1 Tax=Jiulongibacter sediminis TaxID=1605367 RepID=A0A0P7BL28_9BACT|nr:SET domain-containing protein [Jiulongibacter sediminis]KPM47968.1 SET domain protein [Jiulongibacter sediminis]TBX24150.1 SET domain protein [Jiulongibacter sediminis]
MFHPDTKLVYINDQIGYGVFATAFIPEGTITYVKDALEVCVKPEEFRNYEPALQEVIEKYSYMDQDGVRVVSWDFAKYVNHCCHCNSMSTGYGFEIAIHDIFPGEQITDEYGLFNLTEPMTIACGKEGCRGTLMPSDFDHYYLDWDAKVSKSIQHLFDVPQPLYPVMDQKTIAEIEELKKRPESYKSVYALKHKLLKAA